jgi:hypothetical protein
VLIVLDDHALSDPLADGLLDVVLLLLIGPDGDRSPQLAAQQRVEWLCQLALDRIFVADQQSREERQVELPPEWAVSLAVGCLAVSDPRLVRRGCELSDGAGYRSPRESGGSTAPPHDVISGR